MDINSGRIRLMNKFDIKSENSNEDIEDFAESTMNELLEWYGYENRHKEKPKIACSSQNGNASSDSDSPKCSGKTFECKRIIFGGGAGSCDWCAHTVDDNKAISSAGAVFCSEMCFSQSRRANFKKNKTCDWCKHVRHTVSYVDFQDGASQLQFCSDKCLNQYKMHIFCRETRAHLEMHPHVPEDGKSAGVLITPDLWLKNCTQADNMSTSPSSCFQPSKENTQSSPLPLISIVHPSKLMDQKQESSNFHKRQKVSSCIHKKKRKRIQHPDGCSFTSEISSWNDCPQDLRIKPNNLEEAIKGPLTGRGGLTDGYRLPQNCSELYRKFCDYPVLPPPPSTLPGSSVPPVTVLVPYPVMIPVPLPIPIPFDSNLLKNGGKSSTSDSQNSPKVKDSQNVGNNISEDSRKLLDLTCKRDFGKLATEETVSEELDERVSGMKKQDESFPEAVEKDVTKTQKIRLRSLRKRKKMMEGKKKSLQLKCKRLVSI